MTAARSPRSAALLVGSTSETSANVQSAGQSFRFFASARTCRCRFPVDPLQAWKTFPLTSSPSRPNASCGPEPRSAWKAEVATQVRPAHLPPLRLEAVVGAETVGADDAGELVTGQPLQVLLATVGRDPQHRRLLAEGAPERARLAAEIPTGFVDVERSRCARLLQQLLASPFR